MGRGEISSGRHSKRHPLDWYVDEAWCAEQLACALNGFMRESINGLSIWDPACGFGNTLQAAYWRNIPVIGSDLVDNFAWDEFALNEYCDGEHRAEFFCADFLERSFAPAPCSIVCNPPYS